MVTEITHGIKISVQSVYESGHSRPKQGYYVFSYRISIENKSDATVQLKRRHWYIFDSIAGWNEVEGEGVVGQQPVIEPGQSHEYVSGCNLKTDMGSMKGEYQMSRLVDNTLFNVQIPEFYLVAPYRMN